MTQAPRDDLHVLLVGIDSYPPHSLPEGSYPPLSGCVDDVRDVYRYAIHGLGARPGQIRVMTASDPDHSPPALPSHGAPSYEGLVTALRELGRRASPGDEVWFHFSGHGGRVPTLLPEVKGAQGLDETLVPVDIGSPRARHLRDVELTYLLREWLEKGLRVTMTLDCCHSGGAVRDPRWVAVRGAATPDETPRPAVSRVASLERLARHAKDWNRSRLADAARRARPFVQLTACRPRERAFEYAFDGRSRRGVFTYWLVESLRRLGPGVTYKRLHDRLVAKVHSQFETQTPMLEGGEGRVVFGTEVGRPLYGVRVLKVEAERLLLEAGAPQGVSRGSRFAVYRGGVEDFSRVQDRVARAEVTQAGAGSSWARIEPLSQESGGAAAPQEGSIEEGALAIQVGDVRLRRTVRLPDPRRPSPRLRELARRLEASAEQGFLELAPPDRPADFGLIADASGRLAVGGPDGEPQIFLEGDLPRDRLTAETLFDRLIHLARYRNVQALHNPDPASDLRDKLAVSLSLLPGRPDPGKRPTGKPFQVLPPTLRAGQWVCLSLENRSRRPLNVAVLDLLPDGSITQIYPAGAFLPLGRGARENIPFEVHPLPGWQRCRETLKVFATTQTTDFRWLQLPALGGVPRRPKGVAGNALEALFDALAVSPPQTKDLTPELFPQHEWIVSQLELEVVEATDDG